MRETLRKLMDDLAVGYELSPYETCPWAAFDDEKGESCTAEVRMDGGGEEFEAEMQFMRDAPKQDEKPIEQVFWLIGKKSNAEKWEIKDVTIRGGRNTDNKYGWTEKAVSFFRACVQELKMDKIPDIDEILEREMKSNERFGGAYGGGGSKAPKVKPQALMGMKNGRGV